MDNKRQSKQTRFILYCFRFILRIINRCTNSLRKCDKNVKHFCLKKVNMVSRDKIVVADGRRYFMHLTLELGKDVWLVNIYYRASTHEEFRRCEKSDALYAELASLVTAEWIDRVKRDYMSEFFNISEFEF